MALDFLILYEHTVREYESDLLLKLELERRGYTAEIRQLLDPKHLRLFGKDKPEVLVASCMYDNEAINSHVYNNIGRCNKIVNLHWEQMLSDTQEEGDWFNMNGNAKRCVQTCWGKRTAARLQAHGMDAKNTPVTGAVMMDFLRPEFDGYFKDKETLCREFGNTSSTSSPSTSLTATSLNRPSAISRSARTVRAASKRCSFLNCGSSAPARQMGPCVTVAKKFKNSAQSMKFFSTPQSPRAASIK